MQNLSLVCLQHRHLLSAHSVFKGLYILKKGILTTEKTGILRSYVHYLNLLVENPALKIQPDHGPRVPKHTGNTSASRLNLTEICEIETSTNENEAIQLLSDISKVRLGLRKHQLVGPTVGQPTCR